VYERHDPASQALHRVVRENLATFYAAIEQGWESGLPEFVRGEFSRYLDCSVLERGFAHLACQDCGLPRLVAFTCAGRGFSPTCLGRRMNQTTHNLLAHVLPAQPLRQWATGAAKPRGAGKGRAGPSDLALSPESAAGV
jgi:hypothetical protein